MLKQAIVRKPCLQMVNGITGANLGKPDYDLACSQHHRYIEVLRACNLEVTILEADNRFPDSVFIEDTTLFTPHCAIIMNPAADSRKGEAGLMEPVLNKLFDYIEKINPPGTVEGGDILVVGSHYYIGLSSRTNQAGAQQLSKILSKYDLSVSIIPVNKVLHLKTGVASLENKYLLVAGEFRKIREFIGFKLIEIDQTESYAANSIWVNDHVIMPAGYPMSKKTIEQAGFEVFEVDMSEFRKLDGGVSCLSLRF